MRKRRKRWQNFLRNTGKYLPDYTARCPTTRLPSRSKVLSQQFLSLFVTKPSSN